MKKNLVWIGVALVIVIAAVASRLDGGVLSTAEDHASYTAGYIQYRYLARAMDRKTFEADLEDNWKSPRRPPFTAAYKIGARDAFDGEDPAIDLTDGALLIAKLRWR